MQTYGMDSMGNKDPERPANVKLLITCQHKKYIYLGIVKVDVMS